MIKYFYRADFAAANMDLAVCNFMLQNLGAPKVKHILFDSRAQ